MLTDGLEWCGLLWRFYQTFILTAPIHCRASIDSHSDGTHSLQSIHRLSFWRHPFTAEHPLLRHISTNLMKKQTWSWMAWGWTHFHFPFIVHKEITLMRSNCKSIFFFSPCCSERSGQAGPYNNYYLILILLWCCNDKKPR